MLLPVHGLSAATYMNRYSRAECLHRNLTFLVLYSTTDKSRGGRQRRLDLTPTAPTPEFLERSYEMT
jgi:hypothetical protein